MASSTSGSIDCYAVLGVQPSVSASDLARQYRQLSRSYHPDRAGGVRDNNDRFLEITAAYEVLSDPESRVAYDVRHGYNLRSRAELLRDCIASHNSSVMAKSAAGEEEVSGLTSAPSDTFTPVDGDDDEDYIPPKPSRPTPHHHHRSSSALFTATPVRGTDEMNAQRYRTVVISKPSPLHEEGYYLGRPDWWGMRLSMCRPIALVSCDGSAAAIPVPSVIKEVNGRPVRPGESVSAVLSTSFRRKRSRLSVFEEEELHPSHIQSLDAVSCSSSSSSSRVKLVELQLKVTFCRRFYHLVGSLHLLNEEEQLGSLVPDDKKSEMPELFTSPTTILSVNHLPVVNGEQLREALQKVGLTYHEGQTTPASDPPLLECCVLDGLPS